MFCVAGGLLERLPKRSERAEGLENYLSRIKAFLVSVEQAFEVAFDLPDRSDVEVEPKASSSKKMIPTSPENETDILTTNKPNPVNSNRFETKHAASVARERQGSERVQKVDEVDLDIKAHYARSGVKSARFQSLVCLLTLGIVP